tara:strand:- start:275 stop:496 length:222 start_codon:yes stop_codon:yes gene_type:complete
MFTIDAIHAPSVKKDQQYEYIYRSLLCKPEAELEPANTNRIQLINKQNSKSIRAHKPDREAEPHQPKVRSPIR